MVVFLLSVVTSYLWLVKYSFYRKLVEINRRQRTQKDDVTSVKPAAETRQFTLSSENCLTATRTVT